MELKKLKSERQNKARILKGFIREIEFRKLVLNAFDEKLWLAAVERVTVGKDGRLVFRFKDGTEVAGKGIV